MRNAIIVGGTGGIGRAIARELCADEPTRVLLVYSHDDAVAERTKAELRSEGCDVLLVRTDISTEEGRATLARVTEAEFESRVNVLVYSVAHRTLGFALDPIGTDWERSLDVSVTGFVATVQLFAEALQPGGSVLAVSGLSGLKATSEVHLAMGVAKAALHHSVKYLGAVLAGRGVNVNCLCLGSVLTEGVAEDLDPEEYKRFVTDAALRNPKQSVPRPEEIAPVAAFLCSSGASWIVGQIVIADGGEMLG